MEKNWEDELKNENKDGAEDSYMDDEEPVDNGEYVPSVKGDDDDLPPGSYVMRNGKLVREEDLDKEQGTDKEVKPLNDIKTENEVKEIKNDEKEEDAKSEGEGPRLTEIDNAIGFELDEAVLSFDFDGTYEKDSDALRAKGFYKRPNTSDYDNFRLNLNALLKSHYAIFDANGGTHVADYNTDSIGYFAIVTQKFLHLDPKKFPVQPVELEDYLKGLSDFEAEKKSEESLFYESLGITKENRNKVRLTKAQLADATKNMSAKQKKDFLLAEEEDLGYFDSKHWTFTEEERQNASPLQREQMENAPRNKQAALADAKFHYASYKAMHETHGFFFWLFHHGTYSKEATALTAMKNTLIHKCGMTAQQVDALSVADKPVFSNHLDVAVKMFGYESLPMDNANYTIGREQAEELYHQKMERIGFRVTPLTMEKNRIISNASLEIQAEEEEARKAELEEKQTVYSEVDNPFADLKNDGNSKQNVIVMNDGNEEKEEFQEDEKEIPAEEIIKNLEEK